MYYFVDYWSNPFTWSNKPLPVEGDVVVISAKLQVMLDQNTPILNTLVIDGGLLFFDPTQNVELKAKYIVIMNNGKLQVSRQDEITYHVIV